MTTPRVVYAATIAVILVTGGFAGGHAAATPDRTAHPILTSAMATLTVNGTTTLNGPVNVNMDATHLGLVIRGHQGNNEQPLQVFDYAGNPIAGVASAGGLWVAGDTFRIFGNDDILNATLTVWPNSGAVTLGGLNGPTIYGGAADPNVTSPCKDRPCAQGDRYFRGNGDTLIYLNGTWMAK